MSEKTDLKTIHKLSVKDISRNYWLFGTVFISLSVSMVMVFLGAELTDKKRWMAYAVFLFITGFAMPLVHYIRFSDRNKRIINVMIHTKIRNVFLYQYLMGVYQVVMFTLTYGIVFVILAFIKGVEISDIYMLISVMCALCIFNGICVLCMNIFNKYYIALLVYMVLCVFLLTTNSVAFGLLFPLNFENNGMMYFIGKMIEVLIVGVANIILSKNTLSGK